MKNKYRIPRAVGIRMYTGYQATGQCASIIYRQTASANQKLSNRSKYQIENSKKNNRVLNVKYRTLDGKWLMSQIFVYSIQQTTT